MNVKILKNDRVKFDSKLINKVFSLNQILESIIKITKDKMDYSDNESESSSSSGADMNSNEDETFVP